MNDTVLVTGGTGTLGGHLVEKLDRGGFVPRVMSRRSRPPGASGGREWARADLATGEGLAGALRGVDAVIHAASSSLSYREVDVEGTRDHLLPAARSEGVQHLLFPSIVGIDDIPFGYYEAKLEAEETLLGLDLRVTVARATQFHALVYALVRVAGKLPVMPLPTEFRIQPVAGREFAGYLVDLLERDTQGRAPDFAGPESERWATWPAPGPRPVARRGGRSGCPCQETSPGPSATARPRTATVRSVRSPGRTGSSQARRPRACPPATPGIVPEPRPRPTRRSDVDGRGRFT